MKKLLLTAPLLALVLSANSQTQIVNSTFEAWETATDETGEPLNWNGLMTADASGIYSSLRKPLLSRSTDVRSGATGSYSARIQTLENSVFGINTMGVLTLGKVRFASTTPNHTDNYIKSIQSDSYFSESFTDTPDSVVFWVKYLPVTPSPTLKAKASFIIHKNLTTGDYKDPNDISGTNTVATAITDISYNAGNWQRIAVKFDYVANPNEGAFLLGSFMSCSVPGGGSTNDALLIDDVELIYAPKATFTVSGTSVCNGGSLNFTSTSTNYATSYSWNFGDGTANSTQQNPSHTYTTAGSFDVTLTATNQWGSTTSAITTIIVNPLADAAINYAQATYCLNDTDPVPTVTNAGTFTSTTGLIINSATGVIDLSASTPGNYTVTNTYNGSCPNTGTTSITINPAADATFSYNPHTVCSSSTNVTPTVANAGTFSSTPSGVVFANTTTGEIDVENSTVGNYTITHTVAGTVACPTSGAASNFSFAIVSPPNATFSYAQTAYCASATDPFPVLGTGAVSGTFSSTTGLTINSFSGVIDLSASPAGTHTVINTIPYTGICPETSETFNITINPLPIVHLPVFENICVNHPPIVLSGGTPTGGTYSGNGVTAGSFDPSTVNPGLIVISYAYTNPTTGCSHSTVNSITVDACLGLEDNTTAAIAVYPNPTNGQLTIDNISGTTAFKVVTVSGQVVLNGELSTAANTVDLSSFEDGIYVLQLFQEQEIQSVRIIKQ